MCAGLGNLATAEAANFAFVVDGVAFFDADSTASRGSEALVARVARGLVCGVTCFGTETSVWHVLVTGTDQA